MSDFIVRDLNIETQAALALIDSLNHLIGDDEDAKADAVEGETNLHEAIADAVKRMVELDALTNSIRSMVDGLEGRARRLDAQRSSIREAMAMAMEAGGIKRLELPLATLTLKPVPPKVEITEEAALPADFFRKPDPVPDKKKIMEALKNKQDVPGAILSNGGLTIQVKLS